MGEWAHERGDIKQREDGVSLGPYRCGERPNPTYRRWTTNAGTTCEKVWRKAMRSANELSIYNSMATSIRLQTRYVARIV